MSPANDGLYVEIQDKRVEVDCEVRGGAGRDTVEESACAGNADSAGPTDTLG